MSTRLLVAVLLALAASTPITDAAPAPAHAPAQPRPTCRAGGDEVFSIEHKANVATYASWRFALLSNGTYTVIGTHKGKTVTAGGCAGAAIVANVRAELAGARWKIRTSEATCDGFSPHFIEYGVAGRRVFTERTCDNQHLDAASRRALDHAVALVAPFDVNPIR